MSVGEEEEEEIFASAVVVSLSLSLSLFPRWRKEEEAFNVIRIPKKRAAACCNSLHQKMIATFSNPPFFVLHCLVTNKPGDSVATGKKGRGEITTPLLIGAFNHPPDCNLGCKSQLCLHQKISLLEKFFFCCAKEEYSHTLHFMFFLLEDAMCTRCASIV